MREWVGACHCRRVSFQLETQVDGSLFRPRACDCTFCLKHQARYLSDPEGRLTFKISGEETLLKYRQGSGSADFLICRRCGVLVGVVFSADGDLVGAVNARCLDGGAVLGETLTVSPQRLDAETKQMRWREVWTPGVRIEVSDE